MIHADEIRVNENHFDVNRSLVRWGAVFAGLAALLGISWMMFLLGTALGVGVADATDLQGGKGLGIGVTVWLLITVLAGYFGGGLVTGRLSGTFDRRSGAWHGLILWGLATAVMLVLGYVGITGLAAAGASLSRGVATVGSTVVEGAAAGAGAASGKAIEASAGADDGGQSEIRAALEERLSETLAGAAGMESGEARRATQDIDAQTMERATAAWIADGPEAAKQVLARETSMSRDEVERVFANLSRETEEKVAAVKANVSRAVEKTSDVAQGVLWGFFLFTAVALAASIWGGRVGTDLGRRDLERPLLGHPAT